MIEDNGLRQVPMEVEVTAPDNTDEENGKLSFVLSLLKVFRTVRPVPGFPFATMRTKWEQSMRSTLSRQLSSNTT
jgi:hypothetical protein